MDAVQFTGLDSAITAANTMAGSVASTITGNAGWFILFATAGLLIMFFMFIIASLSRLGSGGSSIGGNGVVSNFNLQEIYIADIERKAGEAHASGEAAMENIPLSRLDYKEARRVRKQEKKARKEKAKNK